jgi:transposase
VTPSSSSPQQQQSSFFVGIDVAKDKLDLATSDNDSVRTFDNTESGHRAIVTLLADRNPACIVIESTGGYEWPVLQALLEANLNVARVNPSNVRHVALGLKKLAKTDAIDARTLVRFAQIAEPRLLEKCSQNQAELAQLVTCRRQLQNTLTQQKNRLLLTRAPYAVKAIRQVCAAIGKQLDALDAAIRKLIDSDDQFKDIDRLLRSVPGIGPVASATLASQMPELGKTDRRQAPALLGVVPYNHDSGKLKGQRSIYGGRVEPRNVIYMATLSAIKHNPVIRIFAERLRKQKKKAKVVIVACMRKLITLINAMLRDRLQWTQLTLVKNLAQNP